MRIVFFDTETTGGAERDRILQLAAKERGVYASLANAIYKPPLAISIDSMAVHHITEKMAADKPQFMEAPEYADLKALFEDEQTVAVAHNAAFDLAMLSREGITPLRYICTYKVARALDTDEKIGQYRLQYLRYLLGIEIVANAHDAMGDVLVLEALFERLLGKMIKEQGGEARAIDEMIAISARPMLFTTLRFGKYRGKSLEEVAKRDASYLEWLLNEKKKSDPVGEADWIHTLEHYLSRV
jgi:exodeoxyribonuclease X